MCRQKLFTRKLRVQGGGIEVTDGCSLLQLQKNEVGRLMNRTVSSDPNHQQVQQKYTSFVVGVVLGVVLGVRLCPILGGWSCTLITFLTNKHI